MSFHIRSYSIRTTDIKLELSSAEGKFGEIAKARVPNAPRKLIYQSLVSIYPSNN